MDKKEKERLKARNTERIRRILQYRNSDADYQKLRRQEYNQERALLIEENLGLPKHVAGKYSKRFRKLERQIFDEIYPEGCEGLIFAVDNAGNPESFSDYAFECVTGRVLDALKNQGVIRLSSTITGNYKSLTISQGVLEEEFERTPTDEEIVDYCNKDKKNPKLRGYHVRAFRDQKRVLLNPNQRVYEESPIERAVFSEKIEIIMAFLNNGVLSDREKDVVKRRKGLKV